MRIDNVVVITFSGFRKVIDAPGTRTRNDQPLGTKQSDEATSAGTRQKQSQAQRQRASGR